jgi:predicted O-methyltransferase YrrM
VNTSAAATNERVNEWVNQWLDEPAPIAAARLRAQEVGLSCVAPALGSLLGSLARLVGARTVVETGTGAGVSGLWLLSGMRPDGILTSIDNEPEHQRLARLAFTEAEVPSSRARLISGQALEVLPRLADAGYDLAHLDADLSSYADQLIAARRLVRPGGVVVLSGILRGGRLADPVSRDADSVALRALLAGLRAEEGTTPALLPIGDGALVAPC